MPSSRDSAGSNGYFILLHFFVPLSHLTSSMINETDPNYFPHLQYSARDLPVRHYLPRPSFV